MATKKTIKIKSLTSTSVVVGDDGKSVKIPANVPFPEVGDSVEINSDWVLDPKHPDTKAPVPVKVEDIGTDAAQAAVAAGNK